MRKLLFSALICAGMMSAQSISIGGLAGVPFTNAVSGSYSYQSPNFVVGPALQVNLPLSLRIEVDALYRPVKFSVALGEGVGQFSGSQLQFPFLLQYRFSTPIVKPFAEAGVSFDHIANISNAANNLTLHRTGAAFVLGGGVDVKIPFVRLSGEIRYVRETTAEFVNFSNLNQAEVLVGFHF